LIETVNGKTILLCQLGLLNGKLQVWTFEDKNGDGKIQYYNDNSKDAAFLAAQN
jgi:cation/acetate symporter